MEALWVLNDFMDGKLRPAIDAIYAAFEAVETPIEALRGFITDDLIPAFNDFKEQGPGGQGLRRR